METNNNEGQPLQPGQPSDPTNNKPNIPPSNPKAMPDPMQAADARDIGMARVMRTTSREDRSAIVQAVLSGLDPNEPRRAEDALARFPWPVNAPRRSLGAIMSHLSRLGFIAEAGWTKGRRGPSHAGRVSLWIRKEVAP